MTHHPVIVGFLLGVAVALALICSVGLLIVRDASQRLHFSSPVVIFSTLLIVVAIFVDETDSQARIKAVLILVLLGLTNSVLSHATARAIWIRRRGHWKPDPGEEIPMLKPEGMPGFAPDRTDAA